MRGGGEREFLHDAVGAVDLIAFNEGQGVGCEGIGDVERGAGGGDFRQDDVWALGWQNLDGLCGQRGDEGGGERLEGFGVRAGKERGFFVVRGKPGEGDFEGRWQIFGEGGGDALAQEGVGDVGLREGRQIEESGQRAFRHGLRSFGTQTWAQILAAGGEGAGQGGLRGPGEWQA